MILRDMFGPNVPQGQRQGSPMQQNPMGMQYAPPGQGSHRPSFNYQAGFMNPNTQLSPMSQISLPQQRFDLMRQMSADQINRGARIAQQDLQRSYAGRGIGRSGLEMGAAAQQYARGAGQQLADVNRAQTAEQLGLEFNEAQRWRDLEAQRRYQQAGLNFQWQQAQAGENLARSQLGLNEAIQLGQLGLAERAQMLGEFGAREKYENPGLALGPAYTAAQAAASAGGGGKGK